MDVSRPHSAVVGALDGDILVALARLDAPVTGRKLAKLTRRGSQTGINRRIRSLVDQGIIEEVRLGSARLYSLNRKHLAAPAVEILASIRKTFFQRLEMEVKAWSVAPHHVSVFGSAARGDGGLQSDIDLLVVQPSIPPRKEPIWRKQLADLGHAVLSWTGNHLSVSEVPEAKLPQLRRRMPPALQEARRDAVTLYGPALDHLLGGAQR